MRNRGHIGLHRLAGLISLLLVAGVVAFGGGTAFAASVQTVTVGTSLSPRDLTVAPGTKVTWQATGDGEHRIRSTSGPAELDSNNLEQGDSWSFTFSTPGKYVYLDDRNKDNLALHGTVTVGTAGSDPGASPGMPAMPGMPAAAPAAPTTAAVSLAGETFTPASVTIAVGGTVTWTNDDSAPHNVTSNTGAFPASPTLTPGQVFSHTFTTAGTFGYNCTFHSGMNGTVIVTAANGTVPPPAPGAPEAPGAPAPVAAPAAPAVPAVPATPGQPGKHTVTVSDAGFTPATLQARAGDTVTWVNTGAMPHTATVAGGFDLILAVGASASTVLQAPGTLNYVCTYHSYMTGTIVVSAALPGVTIAPAAPTAAAPKTPVVGAGKAAPAIPAKPGQPGKHTVTVSDAGFTPATLQARAGDTVTWVNNGAMPHTATVAGGFDLIMAPGASASTVLQKPGTLNYVCTYHSYMKGSIVVSAALPGVKVAPAGPAKAGTKPPKATASAPGSAAPAPAASGKSKTYSVQVKDNTFSPSTVNARVGDTISWVNVGKMPHTVTAQDKSFDKVLAPGERYSYALRAQGTVAYVCTYHPGMNGTIVVGAALAGVAVPPPSANSGSSGSGTTSAGAGATTPVAAAPAAGSAKAKTHEIKVNEMTFSPATLTARVGDTISWVNVGKIPHTVTAQNKSFDKALAPGERYNLVLTKEGSIPYVCTYHPGMDGSLTVGPALAGAAPATATDSKSAPAAPVSTGTTKTHEVQVKDSSFNPATLNARVGDTISWVNLGKMPHSVTAIDRSFDQMLAPGQRFNLVLRKQGTIQYICTPHPSMFGTIVVEPALADATAAGAVTPVSNISPVAVAGLSTGWLLIIGLLTAAQLRARITAGAAAALGRRIPLTSSAGRQP